MLITSCFLLFVICTCGLVYFWAHSDVSFLIRNSSEGLNGSIGSGEGFNSESLELSTNSYAYDPGSPPPPPGPDELPPPPPDMA